MNILLTGSEGFIGTHVKKRLVRHDVMRVDCLETRIHGSITGREADYGLEWHRSGDMYIPPQDVVIHLAAQVGVADSMAEPMRYLQDNTLDTLKMLEELSQGGRDLPSKLVVASSMSVYGDNSLAYESDAVNPESVYALTKYDQERLCLMWGKQHGVDVVALRFFNVYGPGQALHNPYTGVIANFVNWLQNDETPTVFEDGRQTRDFVYVDDVADAVVRAALDFHREGQWVFNVCTGEPTTIKFMAEELARLLGKDIEPNITGTFREGDIRHCIGSTMKMNGILGAYARTTVSEGLERYVEWLNAH